MQSAAGMGSLRINQTRGRRIWEGAFAMMSAHGVVKLSGCVVCADNYVKRSLEVKKSDFIARATAWHLLRSQKSVRVSQDAKTFYRVILHWFD